MNTRQNLSVFDFASPQDGVKVGVGDGGFSNNKQKQRKNEKKLPVMYIDPENGGVMAMNWESTYFGDSPENSTKMKSQKGKSRNRKSKDIRNFLDHGVKFE